MMGNSPTTHNSYYHRLTAITMGAILGLLVDGSQLLASMMCYSRFCYDG